MRKIAFSLFALLSAYVSVAQIDTAIADYQINEKRRAEKKMAFNANPNTQNYDIKYHRLEVTINPNQYFISGKVTSRFIPTENLNTIVFDLSHQLNVSQVKQGASILTFTQSNNQLTINLAQTVNQGVQGEVEITYSGTPPTTNEAFTKSFHNGSPIIWTLSEPFGSKDWWPCKEDLQDKIENIDIFITSPNQYVSVANGLEISQVQNTDGTKTTHFQHNYPIPAYLVALAVTNYQVFTQTAGTAPNTFPIVNYLYPESYQSVLPQLQQTLLVMNLFEELFGPYPFHEEKYGHAQFGWGGGMEHTTVSFMGSFGRSLIAHELGHHWFGNQITCGTWKDIWINEGFAEYMAGLVVEHFDGVQNFVNWKRDKINNITSQPSGNLYLTDAQALDSDRIFSSRITYNKGSMVVHMLRDKLGDEVFYQGVQNILQDPNLAYQSAVTSQIKSHFETVSGLDLTEFFNDWIYGQGFPIYSIQAFPANGNQIRFALSQTRSHSSVSFFEAPVKVRVTGVNGDVEIHTLNNTFNNQEFFVDSSIQQIRSVEINPFKDIICTVNQVNLSNSESDYSVDLQIYPNPSKDTFFISVPNTSTIKGWELFDESGKKILESKESQGSIESISSGIYLIKIDVDGKIYHKKIIKA